MHLSLVSSINNNCSIEEQTIYGKQCVSLIKKYELSFFKTTTQNHYCSFFLDFIGLEVDGYFFFYKRIAITEVTKEMMPAVLNGALLKTGKKIHNEINLNKKRYEVYKETVSIEKFYLTLHSYINQFMKTCKMKSYL